MHVVRDVVSAGRRPVLQGAPPVLTHYEQGHRRLLHDPGLDVLEPVVEPSELPLVQVHQRLWAKVDVSRSLAGWLNVRENVSPGAYHQALAAPRLREDAVLLDSLVGIQSTLKENVVPGAYVQHRHSDALQVA